MTHFNQLRAAAGPINTLATQMRALQTASQGVNQASNNIARGLNAQTAAMRANAQAAQQAAQSYLRLAQTQGIAAQSPRIRRQNLRPLGGGGDDDDDGGRRRRRGEHESRFSRGLSDPSPGQALGYASGAYAVGRAIVMAGGAEQEAENMLRAQAIPEDQRNAIMAQARNIVATVPGMTTVEAMQAVRESRMTLGVDAPQGDVNRVAMELAMAARTQSAITGRPTTEALRPISRAVASAGGFTDENNRLDVERGIQELRTMTQAAIAFSTAEKEGVDPREFMNAAQQAGLNFRRMSAEGRYFAMGSIIQEAGATGGHRAGTEIAALQRFMIDQNGPRNRLTLAEEMGLRVRNAREARDANREQAALIARMEAEGRILPHEAQMMRDRPAIRQGDFRGEGIQAVRPDLGISQFIVPHLERRGLRTEEQQIDALSRLLPTEVSRRSIGRLIQTREVQQDVEAASRVQRADRDAAQARNIQTGTASMGIILNEGAANQIANVASSFQNLLGALGNNPEVIRLLRDIASAFTDMATAARNNSQPMQDFIRNLREFLSELRQLAEMIPAITRFIRQALNMLGIGGGEAGRFGGAIGSALNAISNFEDRVMRRLGTMTPGVGGLPGAAPSGGGPQGDPNALLPMPPPNGQVIEINPGVPAGATPGPGSSLQLQNFNPGPVGGEGGMQTAAIYLDGRQVGEGLFPILARSLNNPNQSRTGFDSRRSLGPVELAVT